MDSVPGVQLDGFAVKKKARVSLTLPSRTPKNVTLASTPHSYRGLKPTARNIELLRSTRRTLRVCFQFASLLTPHS